MLCHRPSRDVSFGVTPLACFSTYNCARTGDSWRSIRIQVSESPFSKFHYARFVMRNFVRSAVAGYLIALLAAPGWSLPMGTAARSVVPADVQQIISVDYRA